MHGISQKIVQSVLPAIEDNELINDMATGMSLYPTSVPLSIVLYSHKQFAYASAAMMVQASLV